MLTSADLKVYEVATCNFDFTQVAKIHALPIPPAHKQMFNKKKIVSEKAVFETPAELNGIIYLPGASSLRSRMSELCEEYKNKNNVKYSQIRMNTLLCDVLLQVARLIESEAHSKTKDLIPIMVYGHSTGWSSGVDLYSYAEFDSIDHDDKYRMMDIAARGSNRDGAALRFVAEQLSRRTEEVRILMLVSDGQPADTGYGGTAAEEDLRGIKQEYRRKGLLFVAAAIGDDKENIERIYGNSFMDITDLSLHFSVYQGVCRAYCS